MAGKVDYTCAMCGEWAAETRKEKAEAKREGVWFCPDCIAIEQIRAFPYNDDCEAFADCW